MRPRAGLTLGRLPRAGKCEPDAAADQKKSTQARGEADALRGHEASSTAAEDRIGAIGERGGRHRGRAQEHDLSHIVARRVDELRNEGAEPEQRFRVAHQHKKSLQEKSPARLRRRADLSEGAVRAQQLPADSHEIDRARDAHPVEPPAHRGDDRGEADQQHAEHDREAELRPRHIEQPRFGPVRQTVRNDQRDGRSGDDGDEDAGEDVGQIKFNGRYLLPRAARKPRE